LKLLIQAVNPAQLPACSNSTSEAFIRAGSWQLETEADPCRHRTLFSFDPPATDEIRAASVRFVRKLSGFANRPRRTRRFDRAVDEVADVARRLIDSLVTRRPRDREEWAARAKAQAAEPRAGIGGRQTCLRVTSSSRPATTVTTSRRRRLFNP
jgi:hypothetical protein